MRNRHLLAAFAVTGVLFLGVHPALAQAPPTIFHYQVCLQATPSGGPSAGTWRMNFVVQGNSILVTGDKSNDPDDNWGVMSGSMIINASGEIVITATSVGWNTSGLLLGYAGETVMFRSFAPPYSSWDFRQARFGSTNSSEPDKAITGTATAIACP